MQCDDVRSHLFARDEPAPEAVRGHLAGCPACAGAARGAERIDTLLRTSVVVAPPLALQADLLNLVRASSAPLAGEARRAALPTPAASRLSWWPTTRMAVAQLVALVAVLLAGWRLVTWAAAFSGSAVIGDLAYALQLVAQSPAASSLAEAGVDLGGLLLWSAVALGGWALARSGLLEPPPAQPARRLA